MKVIILQNMIFGLGIWHNWYNIILNSIQTSDGSPTHSILYLQQQHSPTIPATESGDKKDPQSFLINQSS